MARSLRTVLNVVDVDGVVTFYVEVLGFSHVGGWDRGPDDRGALIEIVPGGVIEVVGHGAEFVAPNYHDLAIAIELDGPEDVDEHCAKALGKGLDIPLPVSQPWGHYSVTLRDPVDTEVVLYANVSSSGRPGPDTIQTY